VDGFLFEIFSFFLMCSLTYLFDPHVAYSPWMFLERIVVSRTFCMPTGMYGVSLKHPSQQLFFTRLDEKFMPALATGLTFSVD